MTSIFFIGLAPDDVGAILTSSQAADHRFGKTTEYNRQQNSSAPVFLPAKDRMRLPCMQAESHFLSVEVDTDADSSGLRPVHGLGMVYVVRRQVQVGKHLLRQQGRERLAGEIAG